MPEERKPALVYAGGKDGRFRFGVPQRDLYAEDVEGMDPSVLKDITGGDKPMYVKPTTKAGRELDASGTADKE